MILNTLFLIALFSIWLMIIYNGVLFLVAIFYRDINQEETIDLLTANKQFPGVSIFIPAYNEGVVIRDTLQSMVHLDYPPEKLEIFVINDDSKDNTAEIVTEFSKKYKQIKLLNIPPEIAHRGKSSNLNYGLKHASHELIAIYDADNNPEPQSLEILVTAAMSDPKIAAVVGKVRTINKEVNLLTRFINIEFIVHQWTHQAGKWFLHRIAFLSGTNFVIKRAILKEMGDWDSKSLTEDTELSLRLIEKGYRIWFCPTAVTWEQEPQEWKVWFKQRRRWVKGNFYIVNKYLGKGLTNPRLFSTMLYMFSTYYSLIFLILVSDFNFLCGIFQWEWARITVEGPVTLIWFATFMMFFQVSLLTLAFEEKELSFKNILTVFLMYFTYCQAWLVLGLMTLFEPKKKRNLFHWDKTVRFNNKPTTNV